MPSPKGGTNLFGQISPKTAGPGARPKFYNVDPPLKYIAKIILMTRAQKVLFSHTQVLFQCMHFLSIIATGLVEVNAFKPSCLEGHTRAKTFDTASQA